MVNSKIELEHNDGQYASGSGVSAWLRAHVYLASVFILIASLVPRLFLTLSSDLKELNFPDSPTYFANAASILERGAVLDGRQKPEVFRMPGYPAFLSAVMVATGTTGKGLDGEDLRTVLVVQTCITSLSVVILYWLARRILAPEEAFIGACLAAFSPWGAVIAGFPLSESLYLLILALLFFVMYLVVEHALKLSSVFVGGVLIGLLTSMAVFVRPIWPLVPIVAIVLFLLNVDKRKKAWILIAVMLICAASPLYLWKARNQREAHFDGLSIVPGVNAYQYFAPSVKAQINGADGDRWMMLEAARKEEKEWSQGLSIQEINDERWRRANAFLREHPFLTAYTFALNAGEAVIHPHPQILKPAGLNFSGDTWVLLGLWVILLSLAVVGLCFTPGRDRDGGVIQRKWLLAMLGVCLLMTLASGITYGAGSRLRAPLELVVPLLAAIGLMHTIHLLRAALTRNERKAKPFR